MTILVAAIGIVCAVIGGEIIIPDGIYEIFPQPPFLALFVVVVSTVLLQMYYSLSIDQKGLVYLKAYLAKSLHIAVTVCAVGFISGMIEKSPVAHSGLPACTSITYSQVCN